jgi:hypothetical protein
MKSEVRLARPEDWAAIQECHRKQNKRDGTCYPLPPLFAREGGFAPLIALALVVERDGEILHCMWFESTAVEMMCVGSDPEGAALKSVDFITYLLRGKGLSGIDCKVPRQVEKPIARRLKKAGFHSEDEKFAHYFMDLAGGER